MKVLSIVGARPNFMKIAPLVRAFAQHNQSERGPNIEHLLVHTGQHYDDRMSRAFFEQLGIPEADVNLGIGSGTHAEQVGRTMIAFEKVAIEQQPDWVIVVGDVNATCACSITAKKQHLRLAHIEAGLRSGDIRMPEEVNRLVTDRLSDLHLTPDRLSNENLRREGAREEGIRFVGNIMIDTLEAERERAAAVNLDTVLHANAHPDAEPAQKRTLPDEFSVVTLHRPSNVDDPAVIGPLIEFLVREVAPELPIVWPIHPRTSARLKEAGLWQTVAQSASIHLLQPLGYHDMLKLNMEAAMMLTDSGGLQEECCVLGTPCLTLRTTTERPITLREHGGMSAIVGNQVEDLRKAYRAALDMERKPVRPELWDGRTAPRIVEELLKG